MRWKTEIKIGDRSVGPNYATYFIADIAANHDGDLERAMHLIKLAKEAGADCAKFQHFRANKIVSALGFAQLGSQQAHQSNWKKSVVETYDQYHTPPSWTEALVYACKQAGIDYMTTPYDCESVQNQASFVPAFKIGSGDITWSDLLSQISSCGKPVLLATGASDMADVEKAVEEILNKNDQLVLLQCNTNYSGLEENFDYVNLKVLTTFAQKWPGLVLGLSDHTPGCEAVLGAVALGARVVEKHFTDDNNREGPDHAFAMNPISWRNMVDSTRLLERALGSGKKIVEANETTTVVVQRRAIRAKSDLSAGQILTQDNLHVLRPCPPHAIDPRQMGDLLGKTLIKDKNSDEVILWSDVNL